MKNFDCLNAEELNVNEMLNVCGGTEPNKDPDVLADDGDALILQ